MPVQKNTCQYKQVTCQHKLVALNLSDTADMKGHTVIIKGTKNQKR